MQGLVHVFQHLAHSVVNLLLGLVYAAVEYRENIVLVRMVGLGVLADNRFRLLREAAGINFKDIATLRYCDMDEERIYYALSLIHI